MKEVAMSEIQPLSPSYGVKKPIKIKKDDDSSKKNNPQKKPSLDEQALPPLKHIDELI
jgi:hypothetical protein